MRRIALITFAALSLTSCNYHKARVAIDLTNKSHTPIKNIEIDYPGGTYGITALDIYAVNHHTVEVDNKGCTLKVSFEDAGGHAFGGNEIKMGDQCPPHISLLVNAQLAVSGEPEK